ncbi:hypothetical protein E3N88_11421 [Mikania micrantha]|uniref:Uncharacterized protein n=1 Tax=Mikania micrantha TaxID=192012 RepID=A0A5N6PDC0_9ASTR|nr:hypothetical protein E3N88_11421 [Mikania micrantha]
MGCGGIGFFWPKMRPVTGLSGEDDDECVDMVAPIVTVSPRPLCNYQMALANQACAFLPFVQVPPSAPRAPYGPPAPPSDGDDDGDGDDEGDDDDEDEGDGGGGGDDDEGDSDDGGGGSDDDDDDDDEDDDDDLDYDDSPEPHGYGHTHEGDGDHDHDTVRQVGLFVFDIYLTQCFCDWAGMLDRTLMGKWSK